jgi:hypothetical protein
MIWKTVATIILLFSSILFLLEILKLRKYSFIDARVIGYVTVYDSDGNTYKPKIEYRTVENKVGTYTPGSSSSFKLFKVGATVKLLYDGSNNRVLGILHLLDRFFLPFILFVVSGALLLFSMDYTVQLKFFEWIHNF